MHRTAAGIVSLIIAALLLAACTSQSNQTTPASSTSPTSTASPTPTATAAVTAVPAAPAVPASTPSPTPVPTTAPPTTAPPPPSPAPPPQPAAWCTASASYNAQYNDYDIYVHSNQPYRTATATASNGKSFSYETDASGYADIYLFADAGNTVTVTVGAASCSTTA